MIGLAVITYKRFDYIVKSLTALKENNYGGADIVVLIEDDYGYDLDQQSILKDLLPDSSLYFRQENSGIGPAKNRALEVLLSKESEHIFLMENDIIVKNPEVCQKYIDYAKKSNVQHMNFALHGPLNKGNKRVENNKTVYPHSVGAFSYYTKECIEKVGLFDENFKNALEHVEHTWRIAKAGLTTPFWSFIDHPDSGELLSEIEESVYNSSILAREDAQENIQIAREYWHKKHGFYII